MIHHFDTMVSCEEGMRDVFSMLEKAAPTNATVLLLGESGTGKEVVATGVHHLSKRSKEAFIAINCAAIPDTLIESELFGHEKGAFTGASSHRVGKFAAADRGTLFLDEIGDMGIATQSKILRALEERVIEPVGSNRPIKVDVRVIAATNKDLLSEVKRGGFRQDLYYRLNEMTVRIPPIRERRGDIHLIIQQMIEQYNLEFQKAVKGISVPALGVLQNYDWPGNVREMRNVVKRAMLITDQDTIWVEHLPVELRTADAADYFDPTSIRTLDEVEKLYITRVLGHVKGNKTKAATLLGIDRSTLYEKIKKYGIEI